MKSTIASEKGLALIATLMVVVLIGVIVAAAVSTAMSVTRTTTADYHATRAFYAAEAGVEHALAQVELALQDGFLSDGELSDITPPEIEGFDFVEFTVAKDGVVDTLHITDGPFAGLYAITQNINVTSRATDGSGAHSAVTIGAQAQAIPMFQFAEFGHGAMEAYTGNTSHTSGHMHVNGNIYMATNDHHIHTVITTPGKFIRDGRVSHKDKSDITVWIEKSDGSEVEILFDSEDTPDPEAFKNRSETELDGRLRTGALGVDSLRLPLPTGVDPYELIRPKEADDNVSERAGKLAWQADMYVTVDLTDIKNTNTVCGGSPYPGAPTYLPDITVERPYGGAVPSDASKCLIFPFKWEAMYDWKELKWIDAIDVDVGALRTWSNSVGESPRIIYVEVIERSGVAQSGTTDKSGEGFYFPVLRMRNGSQLPGPLTVGSMYPLYMWGNYNNVNWQPAAVFGDRTTGLSDCWYDDVSPTKGPTDPNFKPACDTYQYAALITGWSEGYLGCYHENPEPNCVPLPPGKGTSNSIQNLENWRACGSRCLYLFYGSFVTFWAPKIADPYSSPNKTYKAPTRDWSFDSRFLDPQNLPPGTPNVGYVLRASFREVY